MSIHPDLHRHPTAHQHSPPPQKTLKSVHDVHALPGRTGFLYSGAFAVRTTADD